MALLAGLSTLLGDGWAFGHFFGESISLGIPLACISGLWTLMILYRLLVSRTVQADASIMAMLSRGAAGQLGGFKLVGDHRPEIQS